MELPLHIKQLLDANLLAEKKLPEKGNRMFHRTIIEYDWLPGYIVKFNDGRVENARLLQAKIDNLGITNIKIPKKYVYGEFAICEKINGFGWNNGQNAMTIPLLHQLHRLITEGRLKYYDMICGNWIITNDGDLYIIDIDSKCFPKNLKEELFYEASWFLLGDIITGHGGCYMNRNVNHPWQVIVRSTYSKHCRFPNSVYSEISKLFKRDVSNRKQSYDHYKQLACKMINCDWPGKVKKQHRIEFDPNNVAIQLAVGLYLSSLNDEFKHKLIENPHSLKDVLYEVQVCGYDEFFDKSPVPPVEHYEIDDFQKWLTLAEQI